MHLQTGPFFASSFPNNSSLNAFLIALNVSAILSSMLEKHVLGNNTVFFVDLN